MVFLEDIIIPVLLVKKQEIQRLDVTCKQQFH